LSLLFRIHSPRLMLICTSQGGGLFSNILYAQSWLLTLPIVARMPSGQFLNPMKLVDIFLPNLYSSPLVMCYFPVPPLFSSDIFPALQRPKFLFLTVNNT
jgi:hypothetical protein